MSRILLLISKQANSRLLMDWLTPRYQVSVGDTLDALNEPFDLCIADGPALERFWAQLRSCRERQLPVLLPCLLLTSREDLNLATRHLWLTVEDILVQPVRKVELQARVEVLLYAHKLSRQNYEYTRLLELIARRAPLPHVLEMIEQFVQQRPTLRRNQLAPSERVFPEVAAAANLHAIAKGSSDQLPLWHRERFQPTMLGGGHLSDIAEGLTDGFVAVDGDGAILTLNPAARLLLNVPSHTPAGDPAGHLLPQSLRKALSSVAQGDAIPQSLQLTVEHTEISAFVSPLRWDMASQGAVALLRDVTHDVKYRRLQESLIANTSHELRAPLATISVSLEAILDGVVPPDQAPRYLRGVVSEVERLRRLSDDIIKLSKLDHGLVQMQPITFDTRLVAESMELLWGPRLNKVGLNLEVRADSVWVFADFDRVEQVIGNLLENAMRHTPSGGIVTLGARRESGMAQITVTDCGVGIAPEHLPYLWDRFYKVDRARTKKTESGSGLGLSIVKELVERMGGSVFVHSQLGFGSTFGFTLPLAV